MKTIADYQPDPLIAHAIDTLASVASHRAVQYDATLALVAQVAYDMSKQNIDRLPGDAATWIEQAIATASER